MFRVLTCTHLHGSLWKFICQLIYWQLKFKISWRSVDWLWRYLTFKWRNLGMHVSYAYVHARAWINLKIYISVNICTDSLSFKFQRDPIICHWDIQLLVHTVTLYWSKSKKKSMSDFKKKLPTDFFCFAHFQLRIPYT